MVPASGSACSCSCSYIASLVLFFFLSSCSLGSCLCSTLQISFQSPACHPWDGGNMLTSGSCLSRCYSEHREQNCQRRGCQHHQPWPWPQCGDTGPNVQWQQKHDLAFARSWDNVNLPPPSLTLPPWAELASDPHLLHFYFWLDTPSSESAQCQVWKIVDMSLLHHSTRFSTQQRTIWAFCGSFLCGLVLFCFELVTA